MTECRECVYWWDGEYEGNCELPEGHEGHHFDGLSCFIGTGSQAEEVYNCKEHGVAK
jgi:hypothetical protein